MNLNETKFKVIDDLLDAGNQCLIRFSDNKELASEYDRRVATLYKCFEIFFLHGLKENHNPFNLTRKMISNSLSNSPKNFNNFVSIKDNHNLWRFICYFLNKHEIERFNKHLKNIKTGLGFARSYIRCSLNEHTLEKTLKSMLENGQTILKQFYDEESAIRELSKQNEILELVVKLNSVLFASSIDNPNLNSFSTINQENFDNQIVQQESKNSFNKQHSNQLENQLNSAMQNLINNESIKQTSNEERTSSNSNLSSNQSCNNSAKLDLYLPLSRNSSYSSYNQPLDDNTSNKSDEDQIDPNINTNVLLTPIVAGNYLITDQLMANYEEDDNKSDCNTSCSSTPAFHSKELANFEKTKLKFELEYDLMNKQKEQSKIELDNESNSSKNSKQPRKLFTSPTNSTTTTSQDYEERINRLESQNDQLKQENKLLKDQLKKYIDAIQLLQSNDRETIFNKCANNNLIKNSILIDNNLSEQQINEQITKNEFINKQINDKLTTEFNTSAYLNYRDSIEYEKKLVQVAEMNSEIVEYNDRLNRILMQKDAIIRRLKDQLETIRGPLPDNIIQSDDEEIVSIASDNENQSLQFNTILTQNRPLINIYIPSAFLADHKQTYQNNYLNTDSQQRTNKKIKSHHVYQIYIRIKDDEWNCYKRYSQFYSLHQILKKKYQQISELEFPPKKTLGNRNAKVVQDRRKKLESYLRNVLNILQNDNNIYDRNTLIEVLPFLNEKYVLQNNRNNETNSNELNLGEGIVQQQDYIGL